MLGALVALIAALLVAAGSAAALVAWIAALVAAMALLLLGGLGGGGGGGRGHAEVFEEDQAVAGVVEVEVHGVHAEVWVGLDHDALAGVVLEGGEGGALFVLEVEADLGADGQVDAGDALVVGGDGEPAHDVEGHALGGFDQA